MPEENNGATTEEDSSHASETEGEGEGKKDKVNSGFARHEEKDKVIDVFYKQVWPALIDAGWKKTQRDGQTFFLPKDTDLEKGTKGVDYYTRVKDVIDRLKERRNDLETSISDSLRRELSKPQKKPSLLPQHKHKTPRRLRSAKVEAGSGEKAVPETKPLDTSWKYSGKNFPRRSSNVGSDYQVAEIPKVGTFKKEDAAGYDLIWSSAAAKESGIDVDEVLGKVENSIKEEALFVLMESKFDVAAFQEAVKALTPTNGSNWEDARRKRFALSIFKARKDMRLVSKDMQLPMKTCLAYYLGLFKASNDYRLLKTVCCEERMERLEQLDHGIDACCVCGEGGELIICDSCDKEYHLHCLRPRLASVPDGHWECDECVSRKFLEMRESILKQSNLFQKRKLDQGQLGCQVDFSEPLEETIEAVRAFASACSQAFSSPDSIDEPMEVEVDAVEVVTKTDNSQLAPAAKKVKVERSGDAKDNAGKMEVEATLVT